jgi:hypothetical protein
LVTQRHPLYRLVTLDARRMVLVLQRVPSSSPSSSSFDSSSSSIAATPTLTSARRYIRSATASSTQRKYASAMMLYNSFFHGRPNDPHGRITLSHALQWLASLADGRQHATSTIKVYKSALGTEYNNSIDALTIKNPLSHPLVTQLMRGITNENAKFDLQRRTAVRRTDAVTMAMVVELDTVWRSGSQYDAMMLAAVSLSVCGGLRPSELLGSNDNRNRRLTLDQLVFFSDAASRHRIDIERATSTTLVPDHCVLSIHVSKTVQHGTPPPTAIGHSLAVCALWNWVRYRHGIGAARTGDIFTFGNIALKSSTLVNYAQSALRALGHDDIYLTGKCFRIGAASTLAAQGVDSNDIAVTGRWSVDGTMWTHYATSTAMRQRALDVNRRMQ